MTARFFEGLSARDTFELPPTPESAERRHFDYRANGALCGTIDGESMATWGPRYLREARAALSLGQQPGTLWERVAESARECGYCAFYGARGILATREHVATHPINVEALA